MRQDPAVLVVLAETFAETFNDPRVTDRAVAVALMCWAETLRRNPRIQKG